MQRQSHPQSFNGRAVIITGELSGEMHAVRLIEELKERIGIGFSGVGSDMLQACGMDVVLDYRPISLMGLSELVSKLGHIRKAYRLVRDHLRHVNPSLLILVDFPGFNLRIARIAKGLGIPVVYFIPPQVWAWRRGRIETIRKYVDLVISILPFEEELYRQEGIEARYVGHPFSQTVTPKSDAKTFLDRLGIAEGGTIITVMPGSRENEIRRHLPVLLKIVDILRRQIRDLTVLVPLSRNTDEKGIIPLLEGRNDMILLKDETYDALSASQLALIASGSATLEAALLGTPAIVLYRLSPLSYFVARLLVKVKYASLPNLIAGREVFPEYIQHLDPERIAERALAMLKTNGEEMRRQMEGIRESIGRQDSYGMAAKHIVDFLERIYGPLPATA